MGWHTRVRLHALTDHEVVPVTRANWDSLPELASGVDAVIHIAGVNRGTPDEVEHQNVRLAKDVADVVRGSQGINHVVYANSIQRGNGTPYGAGKEAAGEVLRTAAEKVKAQFVDVLLPNLFGEHGMPKYNSFVATFVDAVVRGTQPEIVDRKVELLHAQDAAQALLDGLDSTSRVLRPEGAQTSVLAVYDLLTDFHRLYSKGELPALVAPFAVDLFNTYRAALFPAHYPIPLTSHADHRGRLVETVRSHGGEGQTFVSTTSPGVTRGEHFHLGKVERFVVLSGSATIALRRLFSDDVVSFDISGAHPCVVDMPTMWVHNITNTGDGELTTLFWTHSLFDPDAPDTYWEPVTPIEGAAP